MSAPDEFPFFDERLRAAFDAEPVPAPPGPATWTGIATQLQAVDAAPAVRTGRSRWRAALTGAVGALVGALSVLAVQCGDGRVSQLTTTPALVAEPPMRAGDLVKPADDLAEPQPYSGKPQHYLASSSNDLGTPQRHLVKPTRHLVRASGYLVRPANDSASFMAAIQTIISVSKPVAALLPPPDSAVPPVLAALVATERALVVAPTDSMLSARERRRAALLAQRAELARLRWRTDSLLLALPAATEPTASTDSAAPKAARRWSVALMLAPEQSFFGLRSPAADTLNALRRTHEQGRAGYSAAVTAEYALTDRLSVGAGVGLNRTGAELRLTDRRTDVGVTYRDSATTTLDTRTSTQTVYSVRLNYVVQLLPRLNDNGQVIYYDTVRIAHADTTFLTVVQTDTLRETTHVRIPTLTPHTITTTRILRPSYHFFTVPLLVRYRLGRQPAGLPTAGATRWWVDAAAGAQLQFFTGGSQLVSADGGQTWRTERVGARNGPFRPLTVALTGALRVGYALTPHLSLTLAPTLRWQAQSVYRAATGLRQRPTTTGVQVGAQWTF